MKTMLGVLLVSCSMMLSGCDNPVEDDVVEDETLQVSLYVEDELFLNPITTELNDEVSLPVMEDGPVVEDMIFVGWSDGTTMYADHIVVQGDTRLDAVFEDPEDVFELLINEFVPENQAIITGYTGQATHLMIPAWIGERLVINIDSLAFEDSDLVNISIPRDASVAPGAFSGSDQLTHVFVYGEFINPVELTLPGEEFDVIIADNADVCTIVEGSEEELPIVYADGCPILQIELINSINIAGTPYSNYVVLADKNHPEIAYTQDMYAANSFVGATALVEVEIPRNQRTLLSDTFTGATSLERFVVEEGNDYFMSDEGVVYSKDGQALLLYPSAKEGVDYVIPEGVTFIQWSAFYENTTIETFTIPSTFQVSNFALVGLQELREIIVEAGNPMFHTEDGVLFEGTELIKYPAAKEGSSYVLPADTTEIRMFAFHYNQYLETVQLNDGLTELGAGVFASTTNVTTIDIPSTVTNLGGAINMDSSIDTILLQRSSVVDGSITFARSLDPSNDDLIIYVPDDSVDAYRTDAIYSIIDDSILPLSDYQAN